MIRRILLQLTKEFGFKILHSDMDTNKIKMSNFSQKRKTSVLILGQNKQRLDMGGYCWLSCLLGRFCIIKVSKHNNFIVIKVNAFFWVPTKYLTLGYLSNFVLSITLQKFLSVDNISIWQTYVYLFVFLFTNNDCFYTYGSFMVLRDT